MSALVKVAKRGEVPDGGARVVEACGRKIALFNRGGSFYAIDDACRHLGASLAAGDVYGTRVICPLHGWEYDLTTGASIDDPATRVGCFAVKVEGDEILVEIEGQALDTDQNALNDKC